jgi:ATP-binding cassette subfamily F protein uup
MLENEVADLELKKNELAERLSAGNLDFSSIQEVSEQLVAITNLLSEKENRWLELSEKM